ncbi:hypothetical protein AAVH_15108 [Aphelenchoides avenae]|nr:hypothetical protein AAVH_15108 [Aphelenchus avenae]
MIRNRFVILGGSNAKLLASALGKDAQYAVAKDRLAVLAEQLRDISRIDETHAVDSEDTLRPSALEAVNTVVKSTIRDTLHMPATVSKFPTGEKRKRKLPDEERPKPKLASQIVVPAKKSREGTGYNRGG